MSNDTNQIGNFLNTGKLEDLVAMSKRYVMVQVNNITDASTVGELTSAEFTGATSTNDGVNGLVPKPLAGQESTYLKADGKWTSVYTDVVSPVKQEIDTNLEDIRSKYIPRYNPRVFIIPASSWIKNNSEQTAYKYYTDISISNLLTSDYVEINFNRQSYDVLIDSNICSTGDVLTGKVRLYSQYKPTDTLSGEYIVFKSLT